MHAVIEMYKVVHNQAPNIIGGRLKFVEDDYMPQTRRQSRNHNFHIRGVMVFNGLRVDVGPAATHSRNSRGGLI